MLKEIIVVDADGKVISKEALGSQDDYVALLKRLRVAFFVSESGFNTNGYDSIVHGGKYKKGDDLVVEVKEDRETGDIRTFLAQWKNSKVSVMKREREEEEDAAEPRKRAAFQEEAAVAGTCDDDSDVAAGENVTVFSPNEQYKWYLGRDGDDLYLRPCVRDLADVILTRAFECQTKNFPAIFLISGASGIGKSWSINVFMTELLRAKKKVFFHSGASGRAWEIENADKMSSANYTNDIMAMGKEWIYVYDSPGEKQDNQQNSQALLRRGRGCVTLIFSSPKASNYNFALDKSDGLSFIFNLPTWKIDEMVKVKGDKANPEFVRASYDVWGGNMRALNKFLSVCEEEDLAKAKRAAEAQLDAQIQLINKEFVEKMTKKLDKQETEKCIGGGKDVQDSPGHILTPEPMVIDPSNRDCFQEFQWRFCSHLAEKKFFKHAKAMDFDLIKKLLVSVFQVPSSKGVLFEKVSHLLITNGVIQNFKSYTYLDKKKKMSTEIPKCDQVVNFATDKLKDELGNAFTALKSKTGAIALEPLDTSFDAVDMFILVNKPTTGCPFNYSFYLLQDTIAKKHSFHPVKVLWYCSLFCDVHKEMFLKAETPTTDSDILNRCKYVPIVPTKEPFSFERATSTSEWDELVRVQKLLSFKWPDDFQDQLIANPSNWECVVAKHELTIPKTAKGGKRSLTKTAVGNALVLKESNATKKVGQMCEVIYDFVRTYQQEK